jgi:hypothetical protein
MDLEHVSLVLMERRVVKIQRMAVNPKEGMGKGHSNA